jgi:hypothetical protein
MLTINFDANSIKTLLFSDESLQFQRVDLAILVEPTELLASCCCFALADVQTEINLCVCEQTLIGVDPR